MCWGDREDGIFGGVEKGKAYGSGRASQDRNATNRKAQWKMSVYLGGLSEQQMENVWEGRIEREFPQVVTDPKGTGEGRGSSSKAETRLTEIGTRQDGERKKEGPIYTIDGKSFY